MSKTSPSSTCPCGSGQSHAACCAPSLERAHLAHGLDEKAFDSLEAFGRTLATDPIRVGVKTFERAGDVDAERLQFIVPWVMHHAEKVPLREQYLAATADVAADVRRWLEAQRDAWLSIWDVVDVVPGVRVRLSDRLTGEERMVYEAAGSEQMLPGTSLLARVVDFDGVSVLCGVHPHPLMVWGAARVVEAARERLGKVDQAELRDPDTTLALIALWEDEVRETMERPLPPFFNQDGDEVMIVSQRWLHDDRDAVLKKLRAMPNVEVDEDALSIHLHFIDSSLLTESAAGDDDPFAILTRLGQTVAFASLTAHKLELTANSQERADRLTTEIEQACGGLVKRDRREVSTLEALHQH